MIAMSFLEFIIIYLLRFQRRKFKKEFVIKMNIHVTYRRTSRLSMRIGADGDLHVSAPYLTSQRRIGQFIEEHRAWIEKAAATAAERREGRESFYDRLPLGTRRDRAEAVARLDAKVRPMIEHYSGMMGASPSGIGYRAAKSRWGSCNVRTGHINFSLYLLLLPDLCIEHTVVHELAHLIVPDHGPAFHALMDRFFPRWKEARKIASEAARGQDSKNRQEI